MNKLPVKLPCTITIIARGARLVLVVVAGLVGCCNIFSIWNNSLFSYPLWNLVCWILGWSPNRSSSLWPVIFLDMDSLATLAKSHIRLDIWPSSRGTNISTEAYLEVNLLQILGDWHLNGHSVWLWKWRVSVRLFFAGSRFPPLWIVKITVLTRSLF